MREGHPVYLVRFQRDTEQDQHLSCVTHAKAAIVRKVMRRHPHALSRPSSAIAKVAARPSYSPGQISAGLRIR
ncbi:DUF3141 domain-containing protein [Bradyrhizobium nanningense]|uniref:DUF3141 domain-containing protein n=1 Tax=Bradyrhizobium TaxID=374 RepID=UPI001008A6A2